MEDRGYIIRRPALMIAVLSVIGLICPIPVWAKPTGAAQAKKAVKGWLKSDPRPLGTALGRQIASTETFADAEGEPIYHVVYLQPSGYVIVAADDLVEPIIAFVQSGEYYPSEDNPLGALVGTDMPARIAAARSLQTSADKGAKAQDWSNKKGALRKAGERARSKWDQLSAAGEGSVALMGIGSVSDVRVGPLVQSTWGQTTVAGMSCYNYYTPPYSPGTAGNYPCGCVATAMAQLIRYHEHPEGVYVWSNMPLKPNSSITGVQREAIGLFVYYVAEAVDTTYSAGGSSASLRDASREMVATYEFGNSIHGRYPAVGAPLNGMINPNLDAGLPVMLGLSRTGGGHSVVCDGYGYNLSALYHHLNLGWNGSNNAWYALPVVDTSQYQYDVVHTCVYNIYTSGTGEIISGRVTDMAGNPIPGANVTAQVAGGGARQTTTNASGIYAFVHIPSNKNVTLTASKAPHIFVKRNASTGRSLDDAGSSGNVWGIDFASQTASPPIAYSQTTSALSGNTMSISLKGADDGYPNPPGRLAYVITSLPRYGDLADPATMRRIDTVPYILAGYSNSVNYWPCTYFTGQDNFDFEVDDGGTYPSGGSSEPAEITIDVDNVTQVTFAPSDDYKASWPMKTGWDDSRTQVIYLADEIGAAKTITALALDIVDAPGQTLNYWNIRMKHTTRTAFTSLPMFETSGWTTVYWANEPANPIGWRTFTFQNPFEYNGRDNLMIDFSHDNTHHTEDGFCSVSHVGSDRVLLSFANSTHGSPLFWSDFSAPGFGTASAVPNIRLTSRVMSEPFPADFVHNCRVDTYDLAALAEAWLSRPGDSNWDPACDISTPGDNLINQRDFAAFAEHWLEEPQ